MSRAPICEDCRNNARCRREGRRFVYIWCEDFVDVDEVMEE